MMRRRAGDKRGRGGAAWRASPSWAAVPMGVGVEACCHTCGLRNCWPSHGQLNATTNPMKKAMGRKFLIVYALLGGGAAHGRAMVCAAARADGLAVRVHRQDRPATTHPNLGTAPSSAAGARAPPLERKHSLQAFQHNADLRRSLPRLFHHIAMAAGSRRREPSRFSTSDAQATLDTSCPRGHCRRRLSER